MTKQDIERQVREHIGSSLEKVNVIIMGQMVDIDIKWIDGRTVADVRRWTDANVPGLNNLHMERLYSDATIDRALRDMYDSDMDLAIAVESFLSTKDLNAKESA